METVTDMDIPVAKVISRKNALKLGQLSLLAVACLAAMNASAQTAEGASDRSSNVGFTLGTGYSDNLFQTTGASNSGSYKAFGLVADIDRESRRFRGVVTSDIEFRDYSNSSVEDEPFGRVDVELELRAVPDRFSWMVIDNYGEGTTDPFLAIGPSNREQINVFETGPAVFLPLGGQTEFRIAGLAGTRSFDDSQELDSDTVTATAGVYREINSTTEVGVEFRSSEANYDLSPIADNTIDAAFFSYTKQLASGSANLRVGVNEVEFENSMRTDDAPFFEIGWAREVGRRSSVTLGLINRLIDAGESFRALGDDSRDTVLSLDVYEEQSLGAALAVDGSRADMTFGLRFNKDRYQSSNEFDNDTFQISYDYERALTQVMDFNARVTWDDRDFTGRDSEFSDTRMIVGVERRFSRSLALAARYEHTTRSANNVDFDENQLTIHVRYDLNPSGTTDAFEPFQ